MSVAPLRVAVPNKGTLSETAVSMLVEAGYAGRRDPRALTVPDPRNGVEFFYLRPRDIATYVGSGALDVGITGRDLLVDSDAEKLEIQALGFGHSTFPVRRSVDDFLPRAVGWKTCRHVLPWIGSFVPYPRWHHCRDRHP